MVLLSDTYLPKAFLTSVLDGLGLTGYRALWVSCEQGAAKSDGKPVGPSGAGPPGCPNRPRGRRSHCRCRVAPGGGRRGPAGVQALHRIVAPARHGGADPARRPPVGPSAPRRVQTGQHAPQRAALAHRAAGGRAQRRQCRLRRRLRGLGSLARGVLPVAAPTSGRGRVRPSLLLGARRPRHGARLPGAAGCRGAAVDVPGRVPAAVQHGRHRRAADRARHRLPRADRDQRFGG